MRRFQDFFSFRRSSARSFEFQSPNFHGTLQQRCGILKNQSSVLPNIHLFVRRLLSFFDPTNKNNGLWILEMSDPWNDSVHDVGRCSSGEHHHKLVCFPRFDEQLEECIGPFFFSSARSLWHICWWCPSPRWPSTCSTFSVLASTASRGSEQPADTHLSCLSGGFAISSALDDVVVVLGPLILGTGGSIIDGCLLLTST